MSMMWGETLLYASIMGENLPQYPTSCLSYFLIKFLLFFLIKKFIQKSFYDMGKNSFCFLQCDWTHNIYHGKYFVRWEFGRVELGHIKSDVGRLVQGAVHTAVCLPIKLFPK